MIKREIKAKHLPKSLWITLQVAVVATLLQGLFLGALAVASNFVQ